MCESSRSADFGAKALETTTVTAIAVGPVPRNRGKPA
jgi:hypothetical protein